MATIIQIKRGTGSTAPAAGAAGELAATLGAGTQANGGDRLYIGNAAGNGNLIIGGKYFTDMLDQVHGTLSAASAVIVDTDKRIDELIVGNHATNGGSIQFREGTGAGDHYMALKAPNSVTANITLTLPDGAGTNGQYLQTNGSDTLAWDTVVSSFTVAGDSGSDVVNTGETLTFTGGTGITTSAATNAVTFAIDNTVATLAGTQTFTNKTLTSPVVTTPQINDTSADHQYVFAVSELTADRNVTLPLLTGNDEFTFNAHAQTLTNKTLTSPTLNTPTIGTSFTIGNATITEAELEVIDGATLTTDELNIIDGDTSATSTTVADADRVVMNDNGSMVQVAVTDLAAYFDDEITAMPNLTSVGTLGALAVDNVSINGNTISTTDTNGILVLSPNGSGTINASSSKIINVTDPTAAQDAATKAYVDATSNGLDVKASVDAATTVDLAYNYLNGTAGVGATLSNPSNGAITLDGIALTADMRVLVKDQSGDVFENGIYYVSTVGASGTKLVLTRTTDADTAAKLTGGAFTFVEQGSDQQDNGYVFTHNGTPTIGTTNLPVSQFSGAGQITAGTGLTKSGNTINAIGSATIIANAHTLEVNSSATQYQVLVSGGAALTAAVFGQLSLNQSAAVTGTLPVANGGLGLAAFTAGDMMYATGTTTVAKLAKGTADQILMSNGSVPSWTSTLDGGTF